MARGQEANRGAGEVVGSGSPGQFAEGRSALLIAEIDHLLHDVAEIAGLRQQLNNALALYMAGIYTQIQDIHRRVRKIDAIGDKPHPFEPDGASEYQDRTDAKKPCWICGAGKRAKIHG